MGKRTVKKRAKTSRKLPAPRLDDFFWAVVDESGADHPVDKIPELFWSRGEARYWSSEYGGKVVRVRLEIRS